MKYIDRTLPVPAENLACDEALLDLCESGHSDEILRFWESNTPFVVVGYANHVVTEVNVPACQDAGIPILRRCSGGGTVIQGTGCLSYSLILRISDTGPLRSISTTNDHIMERQRLAFASLLKGTVKVRGQTDLALGDLKFSGNAQRRRKHFLLFHGTFLLDFPLNSIERFLRMPSKEPDYRHTRTHSEFLTNLHLTSDAVKSALQKEWGATRSSNDLPMDNIAKLVRDKYSTEAWNFKF